MGVGGQPCANRFDRGDLMLERVVTGAHYGLHDWLMQRVTAVLMVLYVIFIAGWGVLHPEGGYDAWTALFSSNVMRSATLLLLLAVFAHAWVGVRDVVMDYVKSAGVRLFIYVLVIVALMLYTIWSVQILWGM